MLRLQVPGDKSVTHRALMFAALAQGESRIRAPLIAHDTESTAGALRALGCDVPALANEVRIQGRGLRSLRAPGAVLDCGNSGTTTRLLLGILAAQPFSATLTGDASLRSRPMRRVTTPLAAMGARFTELDQPDRLPLEVHGGALSALDYQSPHASAQVKSAVLLAGLCGGVAVRVREPLRSRDHTERMLAAMGVPLVVDAEAADVALQPVAELRPLDMAVPGDISAAAFLLVAALLLERELVLENVGVNPTRTGILEVLGDAVTREEERLVAGEPVADLRVRPRAVGGFEITGEQVPALVDEIPILAALAACADGETRITGASELRVKESDRIALMVSNLRAIGADADELPDGMVIRGSRRRLAGDVVTQHDHRIAMAFGVLGAMPGNDVRIDHPECAAVSFPRFRDALRAMTHA